MNKEEWKVYISKTSEKELKSLTPKEQKQIRRAVNTLYKGPYQKDIKKLKGRPEWRLRIGGRRVLLRVDLKKKIIVVVTIGPRGDIYK